jgi:hypothetical protein
MLGDKVEVDLFQEVMTKLFTGHGFVYLYLDYILILYTGSIRSYAQDWTCPRMAAKSGFSC